MPKDDREILSGIRLPGKRDENTKRLTKGALITDPDELEKAASTKDSGIDLRSLHDSGAITGTWKGVKVAKEDTEPKKK